MVSSRLSEAAGDLPWGHNTARNARTGGRGYAKVAVDGVEAALPRQHHCLSRLAVSALCSNISHLRAAQQCSLYQPMISQHVVMQDTTP